MPPPTANKNIHPVPFRKILDLRMFNISLHFQRFTNRKPSVFDVSLWARSNLRRLSNNFGISSNGWSFSKKLSLESIDSHHPVNTWKTIVNSSKLLFNNNVPFGRFQCMNKGKSGLNWLGPEWLGDFFFTPTILRISVCYVCIQYKSRALSPLFLTK